jgi:hypothetical protein
VAVVAEFEVLKPKRVYPGLLHSSAVGKFTEVLFHFAYKGTCPLFIFVKLITFSLLS